MIDVTPIESLFSNINLDKYETRDEATLVIRSPNDLVEEKLLKIDVLARNMNRISLDVDSLKL